MAAPVRVGVIGAGFAADLHLDAWRRVHGIDVDVVGVAAGHRPRAADFAHHHRVDRVYADAADVLSDADVNVVDICAPNHLHTIFAIAALKAGKHVVVEKPMTGCFEPPAATPPAVMLQHAVAAADAMVAAAEASERVLCYAENWLYAPPIERVAALLASARGTILRIRGEESHSGTHADANKRWVTAGGGSLLGKGCHPLAAALWLKGEEGRRHGEVIGARSVVAATASLTRVRAFAEERRPFIGTGYDDVEDWGHLVVCFDDGTVAEIAAADTTLGGIRNELTVYSSRAVLEAHVNPNDAVRAYAPDPEVFAGQYLAEKLETTAGWSYPSADERWMQGYPQEMQDFAEAIAHGRRPRADGALGRAVVEVLYAAYVSAFEGRRVDLI
jgi:predicted dehydrogenase